MKMSECRSPNTQIPSNLLRSNVSHRKLSDAFHKKLPSTRGSSSDQARAGRGKCGGEMS